MSVGFRKSLFGFNSNDVIEYIEKAHRNFNKKENELNKKLDELKEELKVSAEKYDKLSLEKEELNAKLEEFNAKSEEIEMLSQKIGKLYLVAQTNSKAIIENSEKSAEISNEEVSKNLMSIDEAHKSLQALRESITKTSEDFVNEVDRLMSSLVDTREQITENDAIIEEAKKEFAEVFKNITE